MTQTVSPCETIDRIAVEIASHWQAFLDSFSGLDAAAMDEPGVTGAWSAKQVVGHVAFWDAWEAADAHSRAAGNPAGEVDWQAENDIHAPKIAVQPLSVVLAGVHRDHAAVVAEFNAIAADNPRAAELAEQIRANSIDHYDEHAAEIRAWRENSGR